MKNELQKIPTNGQNLPAIEKNAYDSVIVPMAANALNQGQKISDIANAKMRELATNAYRIQKEKHLELNIVRFAVLRTIKACNNSQFLSVAKSAISKSLQLNAKFYFDAKSKLPNDDEQVLIEKLGKSIFENFDQLSIAEMDYAFEWALVKNSDKYNAYGSLSIQFVSQILSDYRSARNKFLVALQDAEKAYLQEQENERTRAIKNARAYAEALKEFSELQVDNKVYEFWHECPHYFVEQFAKDGHIKTPKDQKVKLHQSAKKFAAGYIIDNSERKKQAAIRAYFERIGIFPQSIPNYGVSDKNGYSMMRLLFDANSEKSLADQYESTTRVFYCKLLYFQNIMPYAYENE